jgi:hypothetical protein
MSPGKICRSASNIVVLLGRKFLREGYTDFSDFAKGGLQYAYDAEMYPLKGFHKGPFLFME